MHCSLHVHSELIPHETKGPKFYSMSEGMVSGKRTIWRCPIPGCTWVAMEFDAEKSNPKEIHSCWEARMSSQAFSTMEQRVQWFLKHLQFLVGKEDKKKIVSAMKRDGLISKKTYVHDVKLNHAIKQAKFRWYATHNGREIKP
jgi:hypothetical protein